MKIAICDRCKTYETDGIICKHCDTSLCFSCLDLSPTDIRMCPSCELFLCDECYDGMIECDLNK